MKKRFGLAILMLSLAIPSASASSLLEVSLGHSQVIGPVAGMSTVIIGNDGIADATLGGGGTIILTGRSLGTTNLIVLDEQGRELLSSPLNVVPLDRRPTTNIRIVNGVSAAQAYVCGAGAGCSPVQVAASDVLASNETGSDITTGTPEIPVSPDASDAPEVRVSPETVRPAAQERLSLNP